MNTGESSTSSSPVKFTTNSPPSSSPLPTPRTDDIHQLFNYFDENGDGKITASELQHRLKAVAGDEVQLSDEEAEMAVRSSDADGDGVLGFEDFTKMMKEGAEEELREAFRMYSGKSEGVITVKSLRRMLRRLGQSTVTAEECKGMIGRFDVNGDGVLDYDEFRAMMS
ncbi:calmodulin-like 38 [Artemisia annua]|uniref:Calmodulin-like 38 n=1 Tax=Artemisia annua TaxID=35608 RepID=A0A2U1MNC4_ARTAN|nr:calmodulin-like 38 [Artemisia annua]